MSLDLQLAGISIVEREIFDCMELKGARVLKDNNIILIGFMGTGKTTIGKKTAEKLGLKFVDSDQMIVTYSGTSISDIFASKGEDYFRFLESQVLQEMLSQKGQVISTGGGVVTKEANRTILNACRQKGDVVIWLTASDEVVWHRLKLDHDRPLLKTENPQEQIKLLLQQRQAYYNQVADYTIDTSTMEPRAIVNDIKSFLAKGGF